MIYYLPYISEILLEKLTELVREFRSWIKKQSLSKYKIKIKKEKKH